MADYSKQYCDKYDPSFPYDFDILELYSTLNEGEYCHAICEGLGFIAIGKNYESLEPQLLFGVEFAISEGYWDRSNPEGLEDVDCVWIAYDKVINK